METLSSQLLRMVCLILLKLITLLDHDIDRMFQSVELFSSCDSFSLKFLPSPILRPCLCNSLDMVCLI